MRSEVVARILRILFLRSSEGAETQHPNLRNPEGAETQRCTNRHAFRTPHYAPLLFLDASPRSQPHLEDVIIPYCAIIVPCCEHYIDLGGLRTAAIQASRCRTRPGHDDERRSVDSGFL